MSNCYQNNIWNTKYPFLMSLKKYMQDKQWLLIKCMHKKVKRKVQWVPQSQTAALPRHQEEEEIDKTKQAQIEYTTKSTKISSLFPKQPQC